jgi:protein-tyrosine phosphatase
MSSHQSRFLNLDGLVNARDFGGLPLRHGGETHFGVMLRADAPLRISQRDLTTLSNMGLSTVIDLREAHEVADEPNALVGVDGFSHHQVQLWRLIGEANYTPVDVYDISSFYLALLDHAGAGLARAASLAIAAPGVALIHCTAGKDRTGILSALLLESIGVTRAAVIEDFALTEDRIASIRQRLTAAAVARGEAASDFARLLGATPNLLAPALAHLDERYGGARPYLQLHGVSALELDELSERLAG